MLRGNCKVVNPHSEFAASLEIEGEKIKAVTPVEEEARCFVLPGFLDLHVHGSHGFDFTERASSGDFAKAVEEVSLRLAEFGVTAFVPTTVTAEHQVLLNACKGMREVEQVKGALPLGIHMEGPYINPEAAGAQDAKAIRRPSIPEFQDYWIASGGRILTMTLAPEVEGGLEFLTHLSNLGVHPSVGHTMATYDQTLRALISGADRGTHVFNAMRPFHHREPGPSLALLNSNAYIEVIPDLNHLSPHLLTFLIRNFSHRIVAVTDAIAAVGLGEGSFSLGGITVKVRQGRALTAEGRLAGSVLSMDEALRKIVSLGFTLRDVVRVMSYNPRRYLGIQGGIVRPGAQADLVFLNRDLEVVEVYIKGRKVKG